MSKNEEKKNTADNCKGKTSNCKNRTENKSGTDCKSATNKKENS